MRWLRVMIEDCSCALRCRVFSVAVRVVYGETMSMTKDELTMDYEYSEPPGRYDRIYEVIASATRDGRALSLVGVHAHLGEVEASTRLLLDLGVDLGHFVEQAGEILAWRLSPAELGAGYVNA